MAPDIKLWTLKIRLSSSLLLQDADIINMFHSCPVSHVIYVFMFIFIYNPDDLQKIHRFLQK